MLTLIKKFLILTNRSGGLLGNVLGIAAVILAVILAISYITGWLMKIVMVFLMFAGITYIAISAFKYLFRSKEA